MRTFYLAVPLVGDFYAEYPSCLKGNRPIDGMVSGGSLLLYAGRLHVVASFQGRKMLRATVGAGAVAAAFLAEPSTLLGWLNTLF